MKPVPGSGVESLRIKQLSLLGASAFGLMAVYYLGRVSFFASALHFVGVIFMAFSGLLAIRGRISVASFFLWGSATTLVSAIIWEGRGLQDVGLLAYPVLMVGAGLYLSTRSFFLLLGAMAIFLLVLGLQVQPNVPLAQELSVDRLVDVLVTLGVGGVMIWLLARDMQRRERSLEIQIERYRQSEEDLLFLGRHDPLTQLPNRKLGTELIGREIASAQRHGQRLALLFVDLDNFKDVNDSLGQVSGDEFLRQFAHRLQATVRRSDVVCRPGSDQFLVGLIDVADDEDASRSANSILGAMRTPFKAGGLEFLASCSIGAALFPRDGDDFESLMRHAELAMRQAKEAGRNTVKFFNEESNTHITENLHLASRMRSGLHAGEFLLHYQPIYELVTGELIGAEALIRWRSPAMGLVSPGLFIPVAERSGLIVEMGQWVLQQSCQQLRQWQEQGATHLRLAVNLSPVQFKRGNVEEVVAQALRNAGVAPECLELEVTESTLIQDTEGFIQSLNNLKRLGVRISIDDFGTGYSNLAYLQRFEIDKLKIDQSFVKRLLKSPQDRAIVTAIVQMARSLNLVTNAEGVEDAATLKVLEELGCDFAQGFHLSRPLPAGEFWKLWVGERLHMGYAVVSPIDDPANASAFGSDAEALSPTRQDR